MKKFDPKNYAKLEPRQLVSIGLELSPHKGLQSLQRYHRFSCEVCPDVLKKRSKADFDRRPDFAMIKVVVRGSDVPIIAGVAVLYDIDMRNLELGSLFVSPLFRGHGFGEVLINALLTKFNSEAQIDQYLDVNVISKVKYGNFAPIPILKKTGFSVEDIGLDGKVKLKYDNSHALMSARRFYDKVISSRINIDDEVLCFLQNVIQIAKGE